VFFLSRVGTICGNFQGWKKSKLWNWMAKNLADNFGILWVQENIFINCVNDCIWSQGTTEECPREGRCTAASRTGLILMPKNFTDLNKEGFGCCREGRWRYHETRIYWILIKYLAGALSKDVKVWERFSFLKNKLICFKG